MMSAHERADALKALTAIATEAGALVMAGYRRPDARRVEYKGAVDLVTDYDRASEELIRRRVAQSFPGCDLVAEEAGGSATGDRPVFYADPLDGTTNFSHGHPFFAVSIGLVCDGGMPELGVVVAPALGWTYTGARECGASRNGEPCRVSRIAVLDHALLATGFPYDRRTSPQNNFRAFVEIKKKAQGVRRCGAASLDLCLVADGVYDGYWEHKLRPWDLAAGTVIAQEAGGRVTDFDGERLDVRRGSLVASNGLIHQELLAALTVAEAMAPL
jgi:myo-inositol-1(or 4)-monophosphatase